MDKVRIAKNLVKSGVLNKNNAAEVLNLMGLLDRPIEETKKNLNEINACLAANNENS